MPDYTIKEWNENNFDVHCCKYVEQAYEQGKWAFVSDYARFWILYHEGGLYFDTDVELVRNLDELLAKGPFLGIEKGDVDLVGPGLGMGAAPQMAFYREILEDYQKDCFLQKDGTLNLKTVVTRTSDLLKKHGFTDAKLEEPRQVAGIWIYPGDYFCPMDYYTGEIKLTEHTYSIHKYDGSWTSQRQQARNQLKYQCYQWLSRFLPKCIAYPVSERFAGVVSIYQENGISGVMQTINQRYFSRK